MTDRSSKVRPSAARGLQGAILVPLKAESKVAYNSCRNRHCPKCQGATAREWLAEREAVSQRAAAHAPQVAMPPSHRRREE
jgi:hypothetical protein